MFVYELPSVIVLLTFAFTPPRPTPLLPQLELQCEELRAAARALGRVTGAIDPEQVLDSLFSEFCIGK
jgi:tRNA modification GTPase